MPDLSPAAEEYLRKWGSGERLNPNWEREDLAALLAAERKAALLEAAENDLTALLGGEANGRLICAAPDLLAACIAFLAAWDGIAHVPTMDAALARTRAAVAQAKGETP